MLCTDETRWRWRSFDSQASGEPWVRVSALHRSAVAACLSFEQTRVNALKLFTAGSCIHGRLHVCGLSRGGAACTQAALLLTWGSGNARSGAGQERWTHCDSYCNSTLQTPKRYSRDFGLLLDFHFYCFFFSRLGFSLQSVSKEKRREFRKNVVYKFWSYCGWQRQGQLATQEPWLCGMGEFSEEAIRNKVIGCLWHFSRNREEPIIAKAVMGPAATWCSWGWVGPSANVRAC